MKKLLITSAILLLALSLSARDISINTKDIEHFEITKEYTSKVTYKYYVVVGIYRYELYSRLQLIALSKLAYTNKVIKISVK